VRANQNTDFKQVRRSEMLVEKSKLLGRCKDSYE